VNTEAGTQRTLKEKPEGKFDLFEKKFWRVSL